VKYFTSAYIFDNINLWVLAYADDVNLLGDNIDTTKKNTETLLDASEEVGLEINVEKAKYMLLSRQ
jgi:ABC-type antimicrobial peptide transport system ATPase subunit